MRRQVGRGRRGLSVFGFAALLVAAIGVFVAVVALLANFQLDRLDRNDPDSGAQTQSDEPTRPPEFAAADYRQSRFPKLTGRPLVGVNYTHYAFPSCTFQGTSILTAYGEPGVAERIHEQLAGMRRSGVATLRTVIWHQTDPAGKGWGPVPSAGGVLSEPYRSNLVAYLEEVKRFGFARLTIAFEPLARNDPLRRIFRPGKFDENWRFIRSVRFLLKRHGPRDTRIDLFSEGAPHPQPTRYEMVPGQTAAYLRRLYARYVDRYGNQDVTVSAIASVNPARPVLRVQNLVDILRSSGRPLPRWYDVHIGFNARAAPFALRDSLAQLASRGQTQPVVIGDAGYGNAGIAQAIRDVLGSTPRPLEEVTPWYTKVHFGCPVTPPYTPAPYARILRSL